MYNMKATAKTLIQLHYILIGKFPLYVVAISITCYCNFLLNIEVGPFLKFWEVRGHFTLHVLTCCWPVYKADFKKCFRPIKKNYFKSIDLSGMMSHNPINQSRQLDSSTPPQYRYSEYFLWCLIGPHGNVYPCCLWKRGYTLERTRNRGCSERSIAFREQNCFLFYNFKIYTCM